MSFLKDMIEIERLHYELTHRSIHNEDGCIISDRCNTDTYPRIRFNGKTITINQLNVAVKLGLMVEQIPFDPTSPLQRLSWLHTCGNKKCINPEHGRPGTQHDNCNDPDGSNLKSLTVDSIFHTHGFYFKSISEASKTLDIPKSTIATTLIPRVFGEYCVIRDYPTN